MTDARFRDLTFAESRDLGEAMAIVAAAASVGVFRALAPGPASASELAVRLDLDLRAVETLLPRLVELDLLASEGNDRVALTSRSRRELSDPDSPEYAARGLPLWLAHLEGWARLPQVLRTGEALKSADPGSEDPRLRRERIARFMAGMAAAPASRIERLADRVLARRPEARSLLDLGSGPGHIGRAFVRRGLEATLVDRPEVVEFVREEYGLAGVSGLHLVGADLLEDPLPEGPFEILLLSNLLHLLSPDQARRLLRKVRQVAAPGAVLAVADFVRDHSPRAAHFAVAMLMRTESGNTYTLEEHEAWFGEAGFADLRLEALDADRQLLTATAS